MKYTDESFKDYTELVTNEISKIKKEAKGFEEKAAAATELIGAKEALESIEEAKKEYEEQLKIETLCEKLRLR